MPDPLTPPARRRYRLAPPDGSRDPRTEDPTNIWIVHLAGRALLPLALRLRLPANAVSLAGLAFGAAGAACFFSWRALEYAAAGFALFLCWLIADGLDGMIARATGTTGAFGRFLDGACDHLVFVLLYVALAASLGTPQGWALAAAAGVAHALQAALYEGERTRFHRRIRGDPGAPAAPSANPFVRAYDALAGSLERLAAPFDQLLARSPDRAGLGESYGRCAAPALRFMALLSNNVRVVAIFAACLAGNPAWFWWFELGPLTLVGLAGILWHRRIERSQVNEVEY
jgi:CDP-diacylglycerol---serine O-phosphatidyltransferase